MMLQIIHLIRFFLEIQNQFYFAESMPEKMLSSTIIASVDRRDNISEGII